MPTLLNTLSGQDLGFLKMVANGWGLEINAPDAPSARNMLIDALDQADLIHEIIETLPENAKFAIQAIYEHEGVYPWLKFTREFGEVRVMGAAKRDRERPDIHPVNPSELLWYRCLIGRAFLNIDGEPQEYAYIPEEILNRIGPFGEQGQSKPGRPASPAEIKEVNPVSQSILDDACTLLAALRMGFSEDKLQSLSWEVPYKFIKEILLAASIVNPDGTPEPQNTREFLENPPAKSLSHLLHNWLDNHGFDELYWLPHLEVEGILDHNPVKSRYFIFDLLSTIPSGQWWNIDSFINAIHEKNPDFQRPAGNYDTWFIKNKSTGEYLRGFENWDIIDGELIYFLITGPFHWFGLVDLASNAQNGDFKAFKLSAWAFDLWESRNPQDFSKLEEKIKIELPGKIIVNRRSPRAVRYQIARFCEWDEKIGEEYFFHISPTSLSMAQKQGLKVNHFIALLQKYAGHPIQPQIKRALENWQTNGSEIEINKKVLLRVTNPEIIIALRNHPAGRFIQESISPETVVIKNGSEEQVNKALLELGYLTEIDLD